MIGESVKSPHMPYMMLGIAAKSSIAIPIGPLMNFGAISVMKIAMPMATGMAMTSERMVVMMVPKMFVAAPKDSFTGSQSVEVRNFIMPNLCIDRDDSEIRTYRMPMIKKMTEKDAIAVMNENIRSTGFFLAVRATIKPQWL